MRPDQVSNPGPLTYESGALLTALRGPADDANFICAVPITFGAPFFYQKLSLPIVY